ncbi:MAG TPA: RNA polymerase sigma factor, partial [Chthonomonadaceae bacterium]|nr:RNA polymerase sigma factor [Chthonomonadaceae bacterium]
MAIQSTNDLKAARGASERRAQQEFERLYARTRRRAYHFAYRLTRNATEAEDVTQDAYARAWYHFDRYDSARPFEGWLFRIIANRVIDLRRRQKRIQICSLDTPPRLDSDGLPLSGHVF